MSALPLPPKADIGETQSDAQEKQRLEGHRRFENRALAPNRGKHGQSSAIEFKPCQSARRYGAGHRESTQPPTPDARVDALPDVPSMGEFVSSYDNAEGWFGIVTPKGTPAEIIDRLNQETNAVVADPKMKRQLVDLGAPPMSMTPGEFGKLIADQTEKWAKVIRFANVKVD